MLLEPMESETVRGSVYGDAHSHDHPMEYWWRCETNVTFDGFHNENLYVYVQFIKHYISKHTPKGVWLGPYPNYPVKLCGFCLKSGRKRFAYPTREEAFESLKHRTRWRVIHSKHALKRALAVEKFLKENCEEEGYRD